MFYEFTKREKKIARMCIDKAFAAEIHEGLEKFETIIQNWRQGKSEGDRATYAELYQTIKDHEKRIYHKYNVGGSHYLRLVATAYEEGYINDEDIKDFSEVPRSLFIEIKSRAEKMNSEDPEDKQ